MHKLIIAICSILFYTTTSHTQSLHRDSTINELQKLKTAVIKGDKEKVAELFSFPITNADLKAKVEFFEIKEIKISTFDKKIFEKYYSRIITVELINFFKALDITQLTRTNVLKGKLIPKSVKDKSKYAYELSVEKNIIKLRWNANPRDDIKIKEEDMPFEHTEEWHLKFVNGKLKFTNIVIAG